VQHWRTKHNKDGTGEQLFDHDDPRFSGKVAFCQPCGDGPFCCNRGGLARHKCKPELLAAQTARKAGGFVQPLDSQLARVARSARPRAGRLQASRPPRDERVVGAGGEPADNTSLDAASRAERFRAVPQEAWLFLDGLDWAEVDSMRTPTKRAIPSGATAHAEAAFGIALRALCSLPHTDSDPGAAAGAPVAPPAMQEARSGGGFGMSGTRGHKLLLLLPRLLFYDDPSCSRRSLSEAIKHRCCLVLEGKWAELWERAKEADAVERVIDDEEADICDIVSLFVSQGLLGKALKKATEYRIPRLEPDVVQKLTELSPARVDLELEAEVAAYASQHLRDPSKLGDLFEYLPIDPEIQAKYVKDFRRDVRNHGVRCAAGPTGLRFEHLSLLAEGVLGPELAAYCAAITAGAVPPVMRDILSTSKYIALQKKESLRGDLGGRLGIEEEEVGGDPLIPQL